MAILQGWYLFQFSTHVVSLRLFQSLVSCSVFSSCVVPQIWISISWKQCSISPMAENTLRGAVTQEMHFSLTGRQWVALHAPACNHAHQYDWTHASPSPLLRGKTWRERGRAVKDGHRDAGAGHEQTDWDRHTKQKKWERGRITEVIVAVLVWRSLSIADYVL